MALLIGGASAAALGLVDLGFTRRYRLTVGALHWWFMRLVVEGAQGAAAVLVVELLATKVGRLSSPAVWVITGAFAPRFLQGIQYRGGNRLIDIDLKDLFDRLSLPLEEKIDSASASAKAASDRRLTQALIENGISPEVLARELVAAMRELRALEARYKDYNYLLGLEKGGGSQEERLRVLVAYAREIQLIGAVKRLRRSPGAAP